MKNSRWSDNDRQRVRQLHRDGESQQAISRLMGMPRSTVRDILNSRPPRTRPIPPAKELTDAAVDYFMRFREWPTSVTLNATRAANRSGTVWRRHLEGWISEDGQWKPWPQAHDMTRRFGSWAHAYPEFLKELKERRERGDPYVAQPIPTRTRLRAALSAYSIDVMRQRRAGTRIEPDEIEWAFPMSDEGPAPMPPAPARGGTAVIGDDGTGRSTLLAHLVEQDLAAPRLAIIVLQLPGKPSIAHGLPLSAVIDLSGVVAAGVGAVVETDDPDVRSGAIAAVAHASVETDQDVSLVVDDADDVVGALASILRHRDTPRMHVSAAWSPRNAPEHLILWLLLHTRVMFRVTDRNVLMPFYRSWGIDLPDDVLT